MNRIIILLIIILTFSLQAENQEMTLSLRQGAGLPNPAGSTYNITFLELDGTGRTGFLQLNYTLQINEIIGLRDTRRQSVQPGSYQVRLNPRFELGGFLDQDLSWGPIFKWYLAALYEGRADQQFAGDFYSIGVRTDLEIPYLKEFSFDFYKQYEHVNRMKNNEWKDSFEDAGWLLRCDWKLGLKNIADDLIVTYEGWAGIGFANKWAKDNYLNNAEEAIGTAGEWQMFNGIFWNTGKWAISTSFKLNRYLHYRDSNTHDALSIYFGLHRKF